MIFESHAHYEDSQYDADREEVISSLRDSIQYVVNVSSSMDTMRKSLKLAEEYDFIYASVGIHPENATELTSENLREISDCAKHEKCAAIGEIGLDYHWPEPGRDIQKDCFEQQLDLAFGLAKDTLSEEKSSLPLIIHSRDAAKDTYEIMKHHHCENLNGVIHCFSYSVEMAKLFLDMGFYIGIGGVVTFKNSKKLKEVVQFLPLDRILLETDCPYMAPVPFRGKRNDSRNLVYIAREIAALKNVDYETVTSVTMQNALDMYRI